MAAAAIALCKPAARRKSSADAKWKPAEKVTDGEIEVLMKLVRSFKTVVPNH